MMTMEDIGVKENAVGLPEGWDFVTLGKVCEKVKAVKRKEVDPDGELIYLDIGGLDNDRNVIREHKVYRWKNAPSRAQQIVEVGDILFSTVRTYMKNIALVDHQRYHHQIASSGFCVLRPQKGVIASRYIFYYTISQTFLQPLNELQTGSSYPAVRDKDVLSQKIPLPPMAEQERIASKIEELFSELEKGKEQILLAQQQLKTYRQAVLKWAFEGRLTEESAKVLKPLASGLEVVRKLAAEKEAKSKLNKIKQKPIPEISTEELAVLPELPSEMAWVRLGDIVWSVKDGPHFSPKYQDTGVPFISGGNIRPDGIDFKKAKFISKELHEDLSKRCKPEKGDILYTKGGTTGIARVNTYDIDFNVWVHVAVLKPLDSINPLYLQHALNSFHCYRQAQKYTHGVGNQDLGLTRMVLITLPICSLEEQHRIVQEIESRLSVCDAMEATLQTSLAQAEVLRQSILKRAFEGRLG